jgi:hypothetical protein
MLEIHLYYVAVPGCELGCEEDSDADYGSIFECCHFGFVFSISVMGLTEQVLCTGIIP